MANDSIEPQAGLPASFCFIPPALTLSLTHWLLKNRTPTQSCTSTDSSQPPIPQFCVALFESQEPQRSVLRADSTFFFHLFKAAPSVYLLHQQCRKQTILGFFFKKDGAGGIQHRGLDASRIRGGGFRWQLERREAGGF